MTDQQLGEDMAFLAKEFQKVVEGRFGVKLAFDRASIAKLDQLFAGALGELARDDHQNAMVMTAAFLGETVRALAGGRWHYSDTFGPCVTDVPGTKGFLRVLKRAERRLEAKDGEALMDFLQAAVPELRN
jgi:hypothetical protein